MSVASSSGPCPAQPGHCPGLRARAIVLGLLLIPLAGRWIFEAEIVRYTFPTWAAPFYHAVFILFMLTAATALAGRITRRRLLTGAELLCVYAMVSVASAMMSTDMLGILVTIMGFPARFATPENRWNELFRGNLPEWLMVRDQKALTGFYEGGESFFRPEALRVWLAPSAWWMLYASALFVVYVCLANLLRRQWADAERLTFPVVQLPVAMADDPGRFFSHRLMWLGFAIAGSITLMNGLHVLIPGIPELPVKRRPFDLFTAPPWNAVPRVSVSFYFFAITLGFLMPLDLSFSVWGFFFLYLAQRIGCAALGLDYFEQFNPADQAFGAFMAIGVFALLGARGHLLRAARCAAGRAERNYDSGEAMAYRTTFLLLGGALAFMFGFMVAAGMSPLIAVLSLAILMALGIIITRIRAELGFPVHDLHGMGPHDVLTRLIDPEKIPGPALGALSLFYWQDRVFRSHPMPHQLEALRLAGDAGKARRDMMRAVLAAGLLAIPVTFVVYLAGFYELGAATARVKEWGTGYGWETFPRLEGWLTAPAAAPHGKLSMVAAGAMIAAALSVARSRILGFPLHPLGFAVAASWGVWHLWLPIFIGSICKAAVLRSGGLKLYRSATMFFFGLMLGEFVVGCGWTLFGIAFGVRAYDFWP